MKTKNIRTMKFKYPLLLMIFMVFVKCEDPDPVPVEDIELQISTYLEAHEDQYSDFLLAVKRVDLYHLFKTRGPYTLFLPTNEAMQEYYTTIGVDSLGQIELDNLKSMVYNHVVLGRISTSQISLGSLGSENILEDRIATEFQGKEIIVNKN
jgi:uncharacterized surface protein with fasciclin (FAS1) repeats